MKVSVSTLNHLLQQNSWAIERLLPYTGQVVQITVKPLSFDFKVTDAGLFEDASSGEEPAAKVILTPSGALRAMLEPESASSHVTLEGDDALASTVGRILQGIRWDAEEDLSRILGDVAAHGLFEKAAKIRDGLNSHLTGAASMFSEYLLEERASVVKRRHLDSFSNAVDLIRDETELLEKRIQRLEK